MAGALVGLENVHCTIVVMEQADRQAAFPLSLPLFFFLSLACLPRFPSIALIYGRTLLGGSRKKTARMEERCKKEEQVQVWEVQANEKSFLNELFKSAGLAAEDSWIYC